MAITSNNFLEISAFVSSANDTNTDVKFIENGCDLLQLFVCILETHNFKSHKKACEAKTSPHNSFSVYHFFCFVFTAHKRIIGLREKKILYTCTTQNLQEIMKVLCI